ncbi:MAG: sigma-70 family RNA polymerase sigma factor [Novosphingobium sp.]|nr:sigma-70 family RNA polymerase sigma factor [Novosphingobium sp.]
MTRHNDRTGSGARHADLAGLVVDACDDSQIAFEALARHWHPRLIAHGFRLTRERELAEEAVQLAWLDIARGLRSLRDPHAFPAWAYRIVTRRCANLIRKRMGDRDLLAELLAEPVNGIAPDDYVLGAGRERLQHAIGLLPPGQRAALALHYYEEMTIAEVAVALAIPAGTVKTRLMHARNQLRTLLEGADR